MKAAVITLHTVNNYGTQLQAYATQEKLKEYFEEVTFVDYRRPDTYGIKLLNTFTKGNMIKALIIIPTLLYWKHNFGKFRKQYLNRTSKKYLSQKDFEQFEDIADVYFSGSDQVWNTGWNNGVIPPLYLSFVPKNKPKYAYSSSFGKAKLQEDEVKECKKYLSEYRKISVRENSGLEILQEQLGLFQSLRIVDPTLAMSQEFWRKIAPKNKIKGKYILIYNLNRSKEFDQYAEKLAQKTGYQLYRFCTRLDQITRCGKSLIMPDILKFISLIDNAELVLTDSFHATAFSINMNTEPICIYPENYSSRLSDFLASVNCTDRHINNYDDFEVVNRHIDFKNVNEILEKEREKVDEYLQKVVEDATEFYEERKNNNV